VASGIACSYIFGGQYGIIYPEMKLKGRYYERLAAEIYEGKVWC
jgi:hypothetical protein